MKSYRKFRKHSDMEFEVGDSVEILSGDSKGEIGTIAQIGVYGAGGVWTDEYIVVGLGWGDYERTEEYTREDLKLREDL